MYDFIALRVNCPLCGNSLMSPKMLVDNIPGVKLNISFDENKGTIHLSSIYGSYNYITDLKIPPGKEVDFSCPHCNRIITSELKCEECSAHMVPLKIEDEGGVVKICSRAGCRKHSVEFEDLPHALEHFYLNYDYGEHGMKSEIPEIEVSDFEAKTTDKEIIRSGTFLRTYCPHCEESLLIDNYIQFKIEAQKGSGILKLSPFLNVFTNESTIYINEGEPLKDVKCPYCKKSLINPKQNCQLCGSSIVGISVAAVSKLIDFYFCSKKGCHWHGLSNEDIDDIVLEDSREW